MNVQQSWSSLDGFRFAHRRIPCNAEEFPPTLFVSGAFQTMDSWARFATAFAPHTTVLLVDPPGMGRSDLLPPRFGVDFLAACLEQVLDEQGIERVNLVAASYGTPSALALAAKSPERIDRVVLAGTMKEIPSHLRGRIAGTVELARRGDREALARECVDGMLCNDPDAPIDRRHAAARVLRTSIGRMSDAELLKYAANTERLLEHVPLEFPGLISGPEALAFTGEHDVFTRPGECRKVVTAFETSWFTTIRRADHLFHLQQWDAVIDIIFRFASRTLDQDGTDCWHELEESGGREPEVSGEAQFAAGSMSSVM